MQYGTARLFAWTGRLEKLALSAPVLKIPDVGEESDPGCSRTVVPPARALTQGSDTSLNTDSTEASSESE